MDKELRRVCARADYRNVGVLSKLTTHWRMPLWKVKHRAQRPEITAVNRTTTSRGWHFLSGQPKCLYRSLAEVSVENRIHLL